MARKTQPTRTEARTAPAAAGEPFVWVGEHPAMDLLNTVIAQNAVLVDLWTSDGAVRRWLKHAGMLPHSMPAGLANGELLREAQRLRAAVRGLAEAKLQGVRLNLTEMNALLSSSHRSLQLRGGTHGALRLEEEIFGAAPTRVLAPLAESAARLLAEARPGQLRRCEGAGCVLWFYDDTPRQRRRWCSMEACGNRAKVAAFRQRHLAGASS